MKSNKFGIDLKKYCRAHEEKVAAAIEEHAVTEELLAEHREKILMLQHERLIHLIVTAMSVVVELFAVYLVLVHPELGIGAAHADALHAAQRAGMDLLAAGQDEKELH